ncbi:MAG TPA: YcnI family protein [Mycolicibacillus parakoreensis]|nr:YcnI family protein [Mycolicibacillus parakoreensis]
MRLHPTRALAALGATLILGATTGIAPAGAHVTASSDNAVRGGYATVTFAVPNESETDAATTGLTITLPDVAAVRTETMPGWTAVLDRDAAAGTVHAVTWTAEPDAGIPADQFGLFRISVALPDTDTVTFPAVQTYADGAQVAWDQPPLPDGSEPERPVPTLALTEGPPPAHHDHHAVDVAAAPGPAAEQTDGSDNTARWLGGAGLLVAAAAVALAVARRRS